MPDPFIQHLLDANRIFADQIKVADQKAATIFTFVLALLIWSTETRKALNFHNFVLADPIKLPVTLLLLASLVTTLCAAICVVLPRRRPSGSVFYWGAWPEAGNTLSTARAQGDHAFIEADLLKSTATLAAICQAKYRLVVLAFRALLLVVGCYLGLLIISN
ncbi:Pycsar system effector family protein [Aureimonas psammosilenae]|uniref:Pycsar system effector family protein n=1 Tax=Aureimonas psammosilenae TaxID=2495496 RepID=UPI00126066BE|nr:Pycsar system effector family protein [Aureimonas psammosilenae]